MCLGQKYQHEEGGGCGLQVDFASICAMCSESRRARWLGSPKSKSYTYTLYLRLQRANYLGHYNSEDKKKLLWTIFHLLV